MAKNSTFKERLDAYEKSGWISKKIHRSLLVFYESYVAEASPDESIFNTYLDLIKAELQHPFPFEPYHKHITEPFDYYAFGINFLRPLVDEARSTVAGEKYLQAIVQQLKAKENVVFLANHQIEADPQAISILLDKKYPGLAQNIIFVAGERVITDPLAVPFSMGRDLLCIYSKRYIDNPPEEKEAKQQHNKKTMDLMAALLKEGGKCIYVAPSGGRDRPNAAGVIEVAPFDPQSVEMFYFMAQKSSHPTHFYTMALATYDLLPPPESIQIELGERRAPKRCAIHMAIGAPINMENFPGSDLSDKRKRREAKAQHAWKQVCHDYQKLIGSP